MIFCTRNIWVWSGERGGAVRCGTASRAGRSRVRIGIFHWHNPSGRTMALGSTQLLTEMSTRNISWGVKVASAYGWQPYHLHAPIVMKSGSLNHLELSGPIRAYTGDCLTFILLPYIKYVSSWYAMGHDSTNPYKTNTE